MLKKMKEYIKDEEFRLTLFSEKVHVINYKEILILEEDRISFTCESRRIVIKGEKLLLQKLLEKEVLIHGKVLSIEVSTNEK